MTTTSAADRAELIYALFRIAMYGDRGNGAGLRKQIADALADTCKQCGGAMKPGKAMGQTVNCGDEGTCSYAGPGKLIDCAKCQRCGWSVTAGVLVDGEGERLKAIADEFREALPTPEGAVLAALIEQGVTALASHIRAVLGVAPTRGGGQG